MSRPQASSPSKAAARRPLSRILHPPRRLRPAPRATSPRRAAGAAAALVALLAACTPATGPVTPAPGAPAAPATERAPTAGGADVARLTLLGTTDTHGWLLPVDYYTGEATRNGLALLAPVIDSVRAASPGGVYLFDSGDLLQGNPLAFVTARRETGAPNAVIRAMNLLGYDAAAIGNHEFNYGLDVLRKAVGEAAFPFVSGNVYRHGTDEHAFRPYALLPHVAAPGDTILIGVTANTPPGVHVWDRANVEGVLELRDVVASLRPVVGEMRARGADVVVVLSHGGLEGTSYDTASTGLPPENAAARLAREVPEIDVIFLGHTHRELADSTIAGVLLVQAKNWAASLAAVELRLERRSRGDWRVVGKSGRILEPAPAPDPAFVEAVQAPHRATLAWVGSVVGRSTAAMSARAARVEDTPILDFINEVQRRRSGADLSATAAFNLDARLPAGEVTIADVAGLYVYDNTLKAVRVSGAQLRAYLEKSAEYYDGWPDPADGTLVNERVPGYNFDVLSGVDYVLDLSRPVGARVTELSWQGRPVAPDQTFTLALNNYRQGGGGGFGMLADAPVVYDRQEDIRELLIDELRERGTIDPADYFRRNWRLAPEAAEAAARAAHAAEGVASAAERAPTVTAGPGAARLRVLASSDFHGRLLPDVHTWSEGREVGGAAALAGYYALERAAFDGPTLLLDGGDVMQGAPISNLTEGRASVEYYDAAGYAAAALGNHEFDWGVDVLRARVEDARFHWLSANLFVAGADTAPSWVEPTALVDAGGGVRVGVLGLSTQSTPTTTRPRNVRGLEFRDGAAAMDRWVPELRAAGADFVVVVAHAGGHCATETAEEEVEEEVEGGIARAGRPCEGEMVEWLERVRERPDLVVAGHTHQRLTMRVNGVPVIQAGAYGTAYGVADLVRVSADSVAAALRLSGTTWTGDVAPDAAVAAVVERWAREVGPDVGRIVTTLGRPLEKGAGEYALGNLIADAQRAATGSQVAIMNNGGIRTGLKAGPLAWRDVFQLHPFGNELVVLQLTGAQLRQALEHGIGGRHRGESIHVSGLEVWYDPERPAGERILTARLESGGVLRDDRLYTVTVNDFMAEGGSGFAMLERALARTDTGIVDLDAMVRHLESLPAPVDYLHEPRLRAAPAAAAR